VLYFGYGSNLCALDLSRWSVERGLDPVRLQRVAPAFLPDRRLAFTHRSTTRDGGVLDIPEARGSAVAGVLFRAPGGEAIATLDRKEGEGHTYRRFEAVALTENGAEERVFSYEVDPASREPFVAPPPGYLDVVRRGYDEHGLAREPLEAAARGASHPGPIAGFFVYGTLRRGEERHAVLARHAVTGGDAATTIGALLDLGPYPGLVVDGARGTVAGELYHTADPDALYKELDAIEMFRGFGVAGSEYRRAIVRVRRASSGAGSALAWTYIYAGSRDACGVIASGDWRERRQP
jgi:gamma-glutamylcyclotransferase (GGCT)/AIG2-like uncharacterized protein YtfP